MTQVHLKLYQFCQNRNEQLCYLPLAAAIVVLIIYIPWYMRTVCWKIYVCSVNFAPRPSAEREVTNVFRDFPD